MDLKIASQLGGPGIMGTRSSFEAWKAAKSRLSLVQEIWRG